MTIKCIRKIKNDLAFCFACSSFATQASIYLHLSAKMALRYKQLRNKNVKINIKNLNGK